MRNLKTVKNVLLLQGCLFFAIIVLIPCSIAEPDITITPCPSIAYIEGTTGNELAWPVKWRADLTWERIIQVYRNNTLVKTDGSYSGNAAGGVTCRINIDGLKPGVYNFTIRVDGPINSTQSSTTVVVVPYPVSTFFLGLGIGSSIVVLIFLIWIRQKKAVIKHERFGIKKDENNVNSFLKKQHRQGL